MQSDARAVTNVMLWPPCDASACILITLSFLVSATRNYGVLFQPRFTSSRLVRRCNDILTTVAAEVPRDLFLVRRYE